MNKNWMKPNENFRIPVCIHVLGHGVQSHQRRVNREESTGLDRSLVVSNVLEGERVVVHDRFDQRIKYKLVPGESNLDRDLQRETAKNNVRCKSKSFF